MSVRGALSKNKPRPNRIRYTKGGFVKPKGLKLKFVTLKPKKRR